MGLFGKSEPEKSVEELMQSYGGNSNVEELETKLVKELSAIFNRNNINLTQKETIAKAKVDEFTDNIVECLLTDETVTKVIRATPKNTNSIVKSFVLMFRPKKKQ
ncbi:MAG: hypothetical protein CVV57_10415 [Tenericutes bacterium HGW-Tenericutes-2]|jgi:NCAIR mutase (PurE)-related protein|nr:MAG: hypothetical protein CVV57_10415 [Tenericutes bacterium HGW-Tenericutes-2]